MELPVASSTTEDPPTIKSRSTISFESCALGLVFGAALVVRIICAAHYRIDSDEPQHLHVVWAWANGLLPYRDLFDNHMPLFQLLCAPLFKALGVRADIVIPMRLAMLPIYGLTIWCVGRIVAELVTARAGWWSAAIAAWWPSYFLTSIEFRPDQLWTLVWLILLLILVRGELSAKRAFAAGLLLGVAFCISMKSLLMLITLALAALGVMALRLASWNDTRPGPKVIRIALALAGLFLPPAIAVVFFVSSGAGAEFYYCVVRHNISSGQSASHHHLLHIVRWIVMLAVSLTAAFWISKLGRTPRQRTRIAFICLCTALYFSTLKCFWPIVTAEDYLPFYPLLAAVTGILIFAIRSLPIPRMKEVAAVTLFAVIAGEIVWESKRAPLFENQTEDKIGIVADALKLTDSGDYVMDGKGETIYRQRPFYYVLEGLTLRRIKSGLIKDDIAERLIATRTAVATMTRMPALAKGFINANYLPIAFRLYGLGKVLYDPAVGPKARPDVLSFDIHVPNKYMVVSEHGSISGTVNGEAFTGARELAAGHYDYRPDGGEGRVAIVWAQGVNRGYGPFRWIKRNYKTGAD